MIDRSYPQAGILNRPPEHVLLCALKFLDPTPVTARATVEQLRVLVQHELQSDLDDVTPGSPKDIPSGETGELGFDEGYDRAHLTITFAVSASGFDALGINGDERPQDLVPIDWAKLGDAPEIAEEGHLLLQLCADSIYIVEHVVRRIEEEMSVSLAIAYALPGVQRYSTRAGRTSRREGRAMIGFLDGTGNLRPRQQEADERLVFVDPDKVASYPVLPAGGPTGYGGPQFPSDLRQPPTHEPAWTRNGTYVVVRASVNDIARWDDVALGAQEQIIGRWKYSGASLDLADESNRVFEEPAFTANQADERVAVNSHARKTNPRRPEDADRRLFRRGYPLVRSTGNGVERGLAFVAFGRTISTQFEFIVRAWMRNPNFPREGAGVDRLLEFDTRVLGGGYYFAPPLDRKNDPWSWILPTPQP